jgi:hypothetical protein
MASAFNNNNNNNTNKRNNTINSYLFDQFTYNNETQIDFSISFDFISNYDLFVFDFGKTILNFDSMITNIDKNYVKNLNRSDFLEDFYEPLFFINFVKYLLSLKKKFVILSFEKFDIIKSYCDKLFENSDVFNDENIITPSRNMNKKRDNIPINKNELLQELARKYNITDNSKIIFFDDNQEYITYANSLGFTGIHVRRGLRKNFYKELVSSYYQLRNYNQQSIWYCFFCKYRNININNICKLCENEKQK